MQILVELNSLKLINVYSNLDNILTYQNISFLIIVMYFGHQINWQEVQPTEERLSSIWNAQTPRNKAELKSFLRLMT